MKRSLPIVFFGSGPVAAATLRTLQPHFLFEAIITKPKPEHHRGVPPVLAFAEAASLPVYTPKNKAELTTLFEKVSFTSPVGLVVDYGIIISKTVIDAFPKGIINSHFSLLPEWRGADPITYAVLSGQKRTGVSLMLINEKLDEGELLAQEPYSLPANITTPELTKALTQVSADMLISTIPRYLAGDVHSYPQPSQPVSRSHMIIKEDGVLDTTKPAWQLEREIRAFSGWPKSSITLFNKYPVIVKQARVAQDAKDGALVLACGEKTFLEIVSLTAPSGRTMSGADFMRGYKK